jgi:hypothetical protein
MKTPFPLRFSWSKKQKQQGALIQLQLANGEVLTIRFTEIHQRDKTNGVISIRGITKN